jgi:chaperonin GroES
MTTPTTTPISTAPPTEPLGPDVDHPNRITIEKLKILHDYLVVRPLAVPSKLIGGRMLMPDTAGERERSHRGIVLGTGPGDFNEPGTALVPMTLDPGDLVFFGKYSGTEERIGPHVVLVMREAECRFCVPAGRYELVDHPEDSKLAH